MELETVNKLYLELSQFTTATTAKELRLQEQLDAAQANDAHLKRQIALAAGGYITASDIARDAIRAISNALTKGMDHSRPALKQDFTALTLRLKECTLIREDIELDPASELKEANRIADGLWNAATLALENDMGDEKSAAEFGGYVLDGHVRQQLEDASMASHEERIKP